MKIKPQWNYTYPTLPTPMGANRGGGTGGRVPPPPPPPRLFRWGTQYQMSPPPPRFGGRMKIDIINVPFCVIYIFFAPFFFFFFFLLVNFFFYVGKVPLQILTCATFDADGAPKKVSVCPPTIRFGFTPLLPPPPPPPWLGETKIVIHRPN